MAPKRAPRETAAGPSRAQLLPPELPESLSSTEPLLSRVRTPSHDEDEEEEDEDDEDRGTQVDPTEIADDPPATLRTTEQQIQDLEAQHASLNAQLKLLR